MAKQETPKQHCGKCGAPLSRYAPEGLCAACLLESAFEERDAAAGEQSKPVPLLSFDDYELLEEIARGGMGVVYRARQISLNRIVAVKMILAGQLANAAGVQRFKAEGETVAQLRHPNIVAIHEVGAHNGQPFFSMDYVEGRSLAELTHNGPLPARLAARYLKTIAEAVQYAHSRGVLHRDLKPSNILIDAVDQPRITDFGLAKRLPSDSQPSTLPPSSSLRRTGNPQLAYDPQLTITGQMLGSPNFMPPEQVTYDRRNLGPASDVYSLGAVLYQLLTGRPPFVAETMTQTLRLVAETEPVSPRLLNPNVPRDLETICLKCLQKESPRRYPTAQELADDLNSFLCDEPIHARPIGPTARLWRWCRRKPALAASLFLILILILIVTIGSPIAAFRINSARQQAEADKKKAQTEATKSQQVAKFLKDMLKGVEPSVALGRDATMLREILDKTAERVGKDLKEQPAVQAELLSTIGNAYFELGLYPKAEAMHREALRLRRALFGETNEFVAISLDELAHARSALGGNIEAEAMQREALAMCASLFGRKSLQFADSIASLAENLRDQGKFTQSEAAQREALTIRTNLLGNEHEAVTASLQELGGVLSSEGKLGEAEAVCREALRISKKLLGENSPFLDTASIRLGMVLERRGKFVEAEAMCRQAVAMRRKLFGNEHPYVASALDRLASGLVWQGKLGEAESYIREAVDNRRKRWGKGERPETRAASLVYLASVIFDEGKLAEAELLYREALKYQQGNIPADDPALARTLAELAATLVGERKFTEAEAFARQGLEIREKKTPNDWRTSSTRSVLGGSLSGQQKYAQAEPLLVASYEEMKRKDEQIPSFARMRIREALQRLIQLYEATNQSEKVAEWKQKLAGFDKAEAQKKVTAPAALDKLNQKP